MKSILLLLTALALTACAGSINRPGKIKRFSEDGYTYALVDKYGAITVISKEEYDRSPTIPK